MGVFEILSSITTYPTVGSQGLDPRLLQAARLLYPQKAMEEQMAAEMQQEEQYIGSTAPRGTRNQKPQYTAGLGSSAANYKLDEKQTLLGSILNGGNLSMLLGN